MHSKGMCETNKRALEEKREQEITKQDPELFKRARAHRLFDEDELGAAIGCPKPLKDHAV